MGGRPVANIARNCQRPVGAPDEIDVQRARFIECLPQRRIEPADFQVGVNIEVDNAVVREFSQFVGQPQFLLNGGCRAQR